MKKLKKAAKHLSKVHLNNQASHKKAKASPTTQTKMSGDQKEWFAVGWSKPMLKASYYNDEEASSADASLCWVTQS